VIVAALTGGSMRYQGLPFSGEERRAIAEYLTGKTMGEDTAASNVGHCAANSSFKDPFKGPHWIGWSPTTGNTHFQPAPQAGLTAAQAAHLTLKWAFGFPESAEAWAQPTIADGHIFIGSQNGNVYNLDAKTGCIYWTFRGAAGVRSAISIGARKLAGATGYALYFSDMRGDVYAIDAATGKLIWRRNVESHPLLRMTGSVTLYGDKLYVPAASSEEGQGTDPTYACCTFRGSLTAVDANTGEILWKTYTIPGEPKPRGKNSAGTTLMGPSGVGIWSAPTIDAKRGVAYVGTGNTYSGDSQPLSDSMIAFDLKTGKIRWSRQFTPKDVFLVACGGNRKSENCPEENGPDLDYGASPILTQLPNGKDVLIAGQKSAVAFALDPDKQGEVMWQYRAGQGGGLGGIEWGFAADSENVYLPIADGNAPTPGGLHAVKIANGEQVWYTPARPLKCPKGPGCNGAQSAAITVIPGVVFSGALDGGFRAFSTKDGSVIWEYDTNRDFKTVNGVPAKGASINGPAPVVVNGMVYVSSGYGAVGDRPGNVFLAFGIE
jgi:polyvinyl alcohol dehydrogenase (cytochrome)